jgi:predicted ABC-type transport system involved in lysophospholipase L1 biosynthesis ATPase subunit
VVTHDSTVARRAQRIVMIAGGRVGPRQETVS